MLPLVEPYLRVGTVVRPHVLRKQSTVRHYRHRHTSRTGRFREDSLHLLAIGGFFVFLLCMAHPPAVPVFVAAVSRIAVGGGVH